MSDDIERASHATLNRAWHKAGMTPFAHRNEKQLGEEMAALCKKDGHVQTFPPTPRRELGSTRKTKATRIEAAMESGEWFTYKEIADRADVTPEDVSKNMSQLRYSGKYERMWEEKPDGSINGRRAMWRLK